jgi:hypothetical protein
LSYVGGAMNFAKHNFDFPKLIEFRRAIVDVAPLKEKKPKRPLTPLKANYLFLTQVICCYRAIDCTENEALTRNNRIS